MIKFIIYLLESSAILAFFYLLYSVLMKKETFFSFNRFYLIGIIVFSLLLPLMSFTISQGKIALVDNSIEEFSKFRSSYYESVETWEYERFKTPISLKSAAAKANEVVTVDWKSILLKCIIGIYSIGIIVCLSKIFWAFSRLRKLILQHSYTRIQGMKVVRIPEPIAPFSFLNYAFIYEGIQDSKEFDQIITHEKTHIDQKHSIDLIFVQFLAAFLWFNPLIWKLIKSLKTTHEYIADKNIIKAGYSLVDYQILLLKQLVSNNSLGLVNNFNLSFIKKRITMMKNKKSGFTGKLKTVLTITCAILFSLVLIQCNSVDTKETLSETEALLNKYRKERDSFMKMKIPSKLFPSTLFFIANDEITLNKKPFKISDMKSVLEQELIDQYRYIQSKIDSTASENRKTMPTHKKTVSGSHFPVSLKIDGKQKMKKVRAFQKELRRLDRRKVIYYGETASGKQMIQPFLVPPLFWADASHDDSLPVNIDFTNAAIEGNVATQNGVEYLNLNLSSTGIDYREEVFRFVKKHVDKKSNAYLVRVTYEDTDIFEKYLTNLAEVFQGFEKIYDVRAQEMFGKTREDLDTSEFLKISEGVYKGVFVAEK